MTERPKCAALNRHGKPCGNRAHPSSEFCYAHDPEIVEERGVSRKRASDESRTFWKGILLSALLALAIGWLFYVLGPSRETQEEIQRSQDRIEEIQRLGLERFFHNDYPVLRQIFDGGYIIFIADRWGRIIPPGENSPYVSMDWDGLELAYEGPNALGFYDFRVDIERAAFSSAKGGRMERIGWEFSARPAELLWHPVHVGDFRFGFAFVESGIDYVGLAMGFTKWENASENGQ